MAQHPIISGLMAIFVVAVIILIFGTLIFLIIEIIDKLCCKLCFKFSKKIYYKIKDRKSGVRVAPQIKIIEAKTTELPVTSGVREIFIRDAIETIEV